MKRLLTLLLTMCLLLPALAGKAEGTEGAVLPAVEEQEIWLSIVYYNPEGGSMYHADRNCKAVGEQYCPLTGEILVGDVIETEWDLRPCYTCGAPIWETNARERSDVLSGSTTDAVAPEQWAACNARFMAFMKSWKESDLASMLTVISSGGDDGTTRSWNDVCDLTMQYYRPTYSIGSVAVTEGGAKVVFSVELAVSSYNSPERENVQLDIVMLEQEGNWYVDLDTLFSVQH